MAFSFFSIAVTEKPQLTKEKPLPPPAAAPGHILLGWEGSLEEAS